MLRSIVVALVLVVGVAPAQRREPEDVYHFADPAPPRDYKRDGKLILDPDFFCSWCARRGVIAAKKRDDMKEQLEVLKKYPQTFEGVDERRFGSFRMMERDGEDMLKFLFEELETKNPVFIEDEWFRIFVDLDGFSTKKEIYPRRVEELEQLTPVFPKVTEKTVTLKAHERAHLYRVRAHRVLRDFLALVGHDAKAPHFAYQGPYLGCDQKFEIYIFGKKRDYLRFMEFTLGMSSEEMDGICWHTLRDRSMVAVMHADGLSDTDLNNAFTHRLSYCLLAGYRRYQYDLPAWVQLGYALLMERRERTTWTTYIWGEGKIPKTRPISRWKPYVRKRVTKGDLRQLSEYFAEEAELSIPPDERPVIWSLMSFLMQRDQEAMGRFLDGLKSKRSGEDVRSLTARALKSAFGLSIPQLDELWRAWVLETYPAI